MVRPWDDETDSLENAFRRARAAFEFMTKLNIKYYTFHDRDVAPEGKTIDESNSNLDAVVDLLEKLKKKPVLNCYGLHKIYFHIHVT